MTKIALPNFRVGFAGAKKHERPETRNLKAGGMIVEKRGLESRAATCNMANGDLYTYPNATTASVTLPSNSQITFTWNPTCLNTTAVDIYLYTPTAGSIHGWLSVPYAAGSYAATLNPAWWNNTATATLQIQILNSGTPRFLTTNPVGPAWKLTVPSSLLSTANPAGTATATGAAGTSSDPFYQVVSLPASNSTKTSIPAGSIAAAVLVPLLAIAVAVLVYVRYARKKEAEKRQRWSQHVDERMSRISGDWRAGEGIAPATSRGSGVGSRRSIAISGDDRGTKASSYFGTGYAIDGNMAGTGAGGARIPRIPRVAVPSHGGDDSEPEMSQRGSQVLRGSIFLAGTMDHSARQSRVSFAEGGAPRMSFQEGGAPRMSRVSFGDALMTRPSLSSLQTPGKTQPRFSSDEVRGRRSMDDRDMTAVSPSQAQGPFSVSETHLPVMATKTSKLGGLVGALGLGGKKKEAERVEKELVRQKTREDDWKQAERTRRSVENLRDMEGILARRSQAISQYSLNSQTNLPNSQHAASTPTGSAKDDNGRYYSTFDDEKMEELSAAAGVAAAAAAHLEVPQPAARAASPMGMAMPAAGLNPDQLLAAYAKARAAKSNASIGQSIEDAAEPSGRRLSVTGDKNPFRHSMVSDTSLYSGTGADVGR